MHNDVREKLFMTLVEDGRKTLLKRDRGRRDFAVGRGAEFNSRQVGKGRGRGGFWLNAPDRMLTEGRPVDQTCGVGDEGFHQIPGVGDFC